MDQRHRDNFERLHRYWNSLPAPVRKAMKAYATKRGTDVLQYLGNEGKQAWERARSAPVTHEKGKLTSGGKSDKFLDQLTKQNRGQKRSINTGTHGMSKAVVPLSNSPASAPMQGHDDHEVPVIPPPRKVAKIHPDYFTVDLPFCIRLNDIDIAGFTRVNSEPVFTLRMNSVYDPFKQIRTPAGLTNPDQDSDVQPQGRDVWAAHFKYYRVLNAKFSARITSTVAGITQQSSGTISPWNHSFAYGYELTDEDQTISTTLEAFMVTKRAKRKILEPATRRTIYAGGVEGSVVHYNHGLAHGGIEYDYNPSSWVHHVEEAGVEERWTPVNNNPGIDHELNFRLFHMNDVAPAGRMAIMVTGYYRVQFREAIDATFKVYDQSGGTEATYGTGTEDPLDD